MAKQFSPTLSELRNTIAETISSEVKAYDLVAACEALGLSAGDDAESYKSKHKYVLRRIASFDKERTIHLAREALMKWDSFQLRESLRRFLCDNEPKISLVTRQRITDNLTLVHPLTGRMSAVDFLGELMPTDTLPSLDMRFSTFFEDIVQHTERNDDWDTAELLDRIGVKTASDELLRSFFELLVHPTVREGAEQSDMVSRLNRLISSDGYSFVEVGNISGAPVFGVSTPGAGTRGRPKNIIFASSGPKPEILLADAVDNEISIAKNAEFVLIYERPIGQAGLTWTELVNWWKSHPLGTPKEVERALFLRLRQSLSSLPEKYFFHAYYKVFKNRISELPALIPQVYLHYDPKTIRELAGVKRFIYQRMDFLLLLPNRVRVVIEIDGRQHYSDDNGMASPKKYTDLVRADRTLRLRGYEIYRFGGPELESATAAEQVVREFFDKLFERHQAPLNINA
jgi:very-short-patch-repair endonuclease